MIAPLTYLPQDLRDKDIRFIVAKVQHMPFLLLYQKIKLLLTDIKPIGNI